ncbi:MAG: ATP-binding protein [Minwuiales bacterium]|nr:ATP-binding protein [Minwuiales bacterium]
MSFRLKTVIGIAAIEIVLLAILIVSGLYYLKSSNEAQLLERSRVTAQLFSTMTSDAVLSTDLATLDALVAQTLKNDGIVYVRVRHASGIVLSQDGDADALAADFVEDRRVDETDDDGRLDVAYPITAAGEEFGRVEIGLSTSLIDAVIADASRWMLSVAAAEIGLVAVFGLMLGSILTRQLARLRRGARRVADGEFGYQLPVSGKDELADTTASFNAMSVALAKFAEEALEAKRQAEAGRDYAETVLHDAMNSMDQSVLIVDERERVEFVNDAFKSSYAAALAGGDIPAHFTDLAQVTMSLTKAEDGGQSRVARLRDVENNPFWQSERTDGRILMNSQSRMSGGGIVVVETDVSDLYEALERNRRLEMELMHSQKMESLGTLASGIAHEINTPIQYIGDNIRFLSGSVADMIAAVNDAAADGAEPGSLKQKLDAADWDFLVDEIPSALREAGQGVQTVGDIVRSVKRFSHPESSEKTPHDLGQLVETVVTVSRNQWKDHATVECDFDPALGAVPCFPGDLNQVLINLIVNAAQAIEESGGRQGLIRVATRRHGDNAEITVADNGPGIPDDKVERIFDLFFTTKAPGLGTGQGLAICRSIVETKHGGRLSVQSTVGTGTSFTISLPMGEPVKPKAEAESAA